MKVPVLSFKIDQNKPRPDIRTALGFETVYQENFGKMLAVAYNQLKDMPLAQDLVHNIFLRLWQKREECENIVDINRYLIGSVKLAVMEHIRNKIIRQQHLDTIAYLSSESSNQVKTDVDFKELQVRVHQLVKHLPKKNRMVYQLSREKEMSNKEIASTLQITEKTAESHITNALKFLRTQLAGYFF